jgi:hypothetical protein
VKRLTYISLEVPLGFHIFSAELGIEDGLLVFGLLDLFALHWFDPFVRFLKIEQPENDFKMSKTRFFSFGMFVCYEGVVQQFHRSK